MNILRRFRGTPAAAAPARRGRLFRRYLVVLVALVGTAVVVTSAVALYFTRRDTEAAASRLLEQTARQSAFTLFQAGVRAAGDVTDAIPARTPGDPPATLATRESAYRRSLGPIKELTYVDRRGVERLRVGPAGTDRTGDGASRLHQPSVRSAIENAAYGPREAFGPVEYPKGNGGLPFPQLPIAVGEADAPGGATIGKVNVYDLIGTEFFAYAEVLAPGSRISLYLVDSRGRLLARSLENAPQDAVDPFGASVAGFPDLTRQPQVAAAVTGAKAGPMPLPGETLPQARAASWGRDPQGREVLSASAPVAGLGWQVLAEQRRADVLAPVASARLRTLIFLVAFLALAVAVSAFMARRMARPIAEMESGARRFGAGTFDRPIEVATGDELQTLSDTMNDMAVQLAGLYQDLESRVDDRTRELTGALEKNAALLRELEAKGRDLERANRHKSEFLATMSHELRTPLNAIIGFSEVLQERMFGELNDRQAEYLDDIQTSGRHLLSLINDVIDIARVEAGRSDLDIGEVDVAECLETGLMMVRERAAHQGVELRLDVAPGTGVIRADGRRLRQVVFNLLSNAVKFTPSGGVVQARGRREDGHVTVSVTDTGPGVAAADQERIFETFRQVGDHAGKEGSGLGLPLSRALVEQHGGRLWVESRVGDGTTFTFTLPLSPP